jgi:hypothetical protein
MMLEGFQLEVARVVLAALGRDGFALGGGYGLQAHGVIDRASEDIDSYTASMDADLFDRMAPRDYLDVDALLRQGWTASYLRAALMSSRPEKGLGHFADLLRQAASLKENLFHRYGLDEQQYQGLIDRLRAAADSLDAGDLA